MSGAVHSLVTPAAQSRYLCPPGESKVPKQYSETVVSRLTSAGARLDEGTLERPELTSAAELMMAAAAIGLQGWMLFAQSPVLEATLAIAASAT